MESEQTIEELVTIIFQVESQLEVIKSAFLENQLKGEKLNNKIKKTKSEGKKLAPKLYDDMNTITCLREWHLNYIERFENFIYESKSIFLDFENSKNNSGFLAKNKKKKILDNARNFAHLGHTYIKTLGNVFDGDYLTLAPGEEIRSEAFKLLSQRLGAAHGA